MLKLDKEKIKNAAQEIFYDEDKLNLDQDKLLQRAKEQVRKAFLKNNTFKYTDQHEKRLLNELEQKNHDHFYIRAKTINNEIKQITDEIVEAINNLYAERLSIKVIIFYNPMMQNNAMALPNGTILIDISLLQKIKYKEELYFIIAHECAHILKQHSIVFMNIDYLVSKYQKKLLAKLGIKSQLGKMLAESNIRKTLDSLRKDNIYKLLKHSDEFEADKIAANVLSALDFSPNIGSQILEKVDNKNQDSHTHPRTSERISKIKEFAEIKQKSFQDVHLMNGNFSNQLQKALRQVKHKKNVINTLSWASAIGTALILIVLLYFMNKWAYSGNGGFEFLKQGLFEVVLKLSLKLAFFVILAVSYAVFEKSYQILK